MKKLLFFLSLSLLFIGKSDAQNWLYGGVTATGGNGYLQTNGAYNTYFGNNSTQMTLNSSGQLGIGASYSPSHLLDVSGGDINANTSTNGYMIGGNYVLWHTGVTSDIFGGVGAGGGVINHYNPINITVFGGNAGYGIGTGTNPNNITFLGYDAGYSFANGTNCTYTGVYTGYSDAGSNANTFAGAYCGYSNNGGDYNTFTGYKCGYSNTTGEANSYYGKFAGYFNNGTWNCMYGGHSGNGCTTADSSSFYGTYSGEDNYSGNENIFIGFDAGIVSGTVTNSSNHNVFVGSNSGSRNPYGNYNTLLGDSTDAYHGSYPNYSTVSNSGAVGADVKVNFNNQMILGNNSQFVGIGESSDQEYGYSGPQWNLEICTEHNNTYSLPGLGGGTATTSNSYSGKGFSGLKFRDLTSNSTPVVASTFTAIGNPFPSGVLSVDGYGNIIYVSANALNWSLTGNAGTSPALNFLGTTDSATLIFKVAGDYSGWIDRGTYQNTLLGFNAGAATHAKGNTAFGFEALYSNTAQSGNIAIGDSALYTQSYSTAFNSGNVAIGNSALFSNQPTNTLFGKGNTAIGEWAMRYNTIGYANTANGYGALYSNTTGIENDANGFFALYSNTTGDYNTGIGYKALNGNTTGKYNTGIGYEALVGSTGSNNTATGYYALVDNTSGINNTSSGSQTLYQTTTASSNTAMGYLALTNNNADANTAFGDSAGISNSAGKDNTYIGYQADNGHTSLSNTTCLGYNGGSYISTNNVSNAVQLGNSSVTKIYAAVNAIVISDRRIKTRVMNNVPGLAFINLLNPVTYNYSLAQENQLGGTTDNTPEYEGKHDIEKIRFSGFLAQDVEAAANKVGYNFSGVVPGKIYGLRYAEFVVPLVKAVQELNTKNDSLHSTVNALEVKVDSLHSLHYTVDSLRNALQSIQACLTKLCTANNAQSQNNGGNGNLGDNNTTSNVQDVSLSSANAPLLYQNIPNPFTTGTKINYYLPQGTIGASIVFYDNYGNQIKTVQLSQTGNGTLNINPDNLSNGIYAYSLIVNGNIIDTKRMVLQK